MYVYCCMPLSLQDYGLGVWLCVSTWALSTLSCWQFINKELPELWLLCFLILPQYIMLAVARLSRWADTNVDIAGEEQ